jgi:3-hydroxyacyl-[acyl-carrier-protein] dehydratase
MMGSAMTPPPAAFAVQSVPPPDPGLCEILKHCSLPTYDAARAFRLTGHPRYLRAIVLGILQRHLNGKRISDFPGASEDLRLIEDLGLDSLSLIEIASVAEDAVGFRIEDGELRQVRTIGDLERLLEAKARALAKV